MTPYDNDVFALYTVDPNIANWDIVTPTQSELEKMLKAAEAAEMDIHVRGVINISQQYQDEHGFRCSTWIEPTNPQEFFDSYTKLLLKLVPLLNKYHVKLLTPFIEMTGIEKYSDLIKKMCTTISRTYKGEIGFEEETANILNGASVFNSTPIRTEEAYANFEKGFTFWNWVSPTGKHIIYEYSVWTPRLETQKDQRVSVMEPNFIKFLEPAHSYFSSTYPQDSQMIGEIGTRDADGGCLGPDYYNIPRSQRVFDEQERADVWYAYFKGSKELGIESLDVWVFTLGNTSWGDHSAGTNFMYIGFKGPISPPTVSSPRSLSLRTNWRNQGAPQCDNVGLVTICNVIAMPYVF